LAPELVIDLDLSDLPLLDCAELLVRQGIGQDKPASILVSKYHQPIRLAVIKPALGKRLQNRQNPRIARGSHAFNLFAERLDVRRCENVDLRA